MSVQVEDNEAVLVESFGRCVAVLDKPGLHALPTRWLPWVALRHVSLRSDFLQLREVHVTDVEGTSVLVDLWVDYRVVDARKAAYAVEHRDEALRSVVLHAAMSVLGRRSFWETLTDLDPVARRLRDEVATETARWGLAIDAAFVQRVSLRPEVAAGLLESVAARLGRARAELLESGRLAVAALEARTSAEVAELVAEAKAQYPAAIGRAMEEMARSPAVLAAYNELYKLSVMRPHRSTAFIGFEGDELRAVDAAMIPSTSSSNAA